MAFASILKSLRDERNLSQKDIADYLGITRQAVAAYEVGKREPDYEVLQKLADFFNVSIDYLLGRVNCREVNAVTVGKNIDLIRGEMTYKELSEDISLKTGVLLSAEMLELYARGERMPFIGAIKTLAKYASVRESFLYTHNTYESYAAEQELCRREQEENSFQNPEYTKLVYALVNSEIGEWILEKANIEYIKLAKDLQESGMPVEVLKPLVSFFKSRNSGK